MTKILTRDQILAVPLRTEEVLIEEWGGSIIVQELTAGQISRNSQKVLRRDGKPDYKKAAELAVELCASQIVDEDGERLFTHADINQLGKKHGGAIRTIAEKIRKISGVGETDEEELEEWLEESYPHILEEFQDAHSPIKAAEENFTVTGNGNLPSD